MDHADLGDLVSLAVVVVDLGLVAVVMVGWMVDEAELADYVVLVTAGFGVTSVDLGYEVEAVDLGQVEEAWLVGLLVHSLFHSYHNVNLQFDYKVIK